jgi:pullulanase/glycogen debranching enzyme
MMTHGKPWREVLRIATERQSDLIVMGVQGRGAADLLHPVLRRRNFFQGRRIRGSKVRDIIWLVPSGRAMTDAEWGADHVKCLGVRLAGGGIGERDEEGQPVLGETLLYMLNADEKAVDFTLPTSGTIRRRTAPSERRSSRCHGSTSRA